MSEFDKAVKHVETCLFWDFVDGQWLDKLYTPLDRDFFNRLMQGVVEAHEAENVNLHWNIASLEASLEGMHLIRNRERDENAKLRELVRDMWQFTGAACKKYPRLFDPSAQGGQMVNLNMIDAFEQRMCELGVEE